MNGWVRPVRTAWVVRDLVPGPDVDEFAEPDQVTAALTAPGAATGTLLAVQHPHRTPAARARGLSLTDALPIAREALDHLRANHYREIHDVVAPYRVDGPDGSAHGVLCLVDPAEVGRIRHTEEVFPDVVAERSAVLSGLGCATSAAMLVPVSGGAVLTSLLADVCEELADPAVSVVDSAGHRHRMWLLEKGSRQAELLELLQEQSLLVADGNHRVAAATGSSLLALITGGPSLRIGAIHRVLTGTGLDADTVYRRWREIGLTVTRGATPSRRAGPGVVVALVDGEVLRVVLPDMGAETPQIDHGVVEQVLVKQALGIDPDGPSLRTLPAGRPVPAGADVLLQLAPVPFTDVLAVHAEGRRMPRKATYFTPKPRSGLLLAAL
ncbi:DUF1015 family protein [Kutzneria kofuensis]|uniref:DUF1015 family protein n=1 Tax=Kutzneria kofuensis TaxID=103725 RepID=UPI0031EC135B